jgi:hypothetical protein
MVFLSLTLKAKANRWANIILGIEQAGVLLGSVLLARAFDPHYIFYDMIEAVLIALIIWYAWKWK